ncbi:MAG: DUF4168 domain-containing protein [Spirochaetaceae bacterium]|nr:MAG: DUF4168 domain-containing protein [Spirochaetaceae bacterium]
MASTRHTCSCTGIPRIRPSSHNLDTAFHFAGYGPVSFSRRIIQRSGPLLNKGEQRMKGTRIITGIVMLLALGGALSFAQFAPEGQAPPGGQDAPGLAPAPAPVEVDLEDGELERFTRALIEVQIIQQEAQVEIQQVIDASSLDMMRFQELHQSMMMQQGLPADVADNEEAEYETVIADIQDLEVGAATEMEDAVVNQELAVERFNEIAEAIPHDPDLAEELNALAAVIIEEDYSGEF